MDSSIYFIHLYSVPTTNRILIGKADIREAWIRGYNVELVFIQIRWDGGKPLMDLHGLVKVRGGVFANVFGAQCEEDCDGNT